MIRLLVHFLTSVLLNPSHHFLTQANKRLLLIDTGCSNISITPSAAVKVGMPIIGKQPVMSTTQSIEADLFLGDLFISYADPADNFIISFVT
jgi:hypothetical protein